MAQIKFSDIPEGNFEIENKEYPLVALDARLSVTPGGFKCIEIDWEHLGSPKFKVNFDKYFYGTKDKDFDMDVKAVRVGLTKLKRLNEATINQVDLDPAVLVKLLKKVKVIAKIKQNDKFLEIDGIECFSRYTETSTSITPDMPASQSTAFTVDAVDEDPFNL